MEDTQDGFTTSSCTCPTHTETTYTCFTLIYTTQYGQDRCRRGSSSPASPTLSSYSSSEGTSILTGDVDDLTSLMTASDGDFQAGYYDNDTMTSLPSEAETVKMGVSELASFLEADSLLLGDTEKMVLQLWANSVEDVATVDSLYKPLFDCVVNNKRQELYKVSEWPPDEQQVNSDGGSSLCMPSLSVVVFLREEPITGEDAWAKMKEHFSGGAWRFHHSEAVSRGKLHAYENNSQDYLIARDNMPLCAMRQLHCGKRILRFLRFVSAENWKDNVNLYSLLLAKEPDVLKPDFCLFTASYHAEYDVQLALKKIPGGIKCESTQGAALCFRVSQVGHTVPLLPNICTPVSDDRWRTTDLDDNVIFLDVVRMRDRSCEPVPDLTDCEISHEVTPTNHKKQPSSYPSLQNSAGSDFQTVSKHRGGSKENYSELKPDEKYDSQHCASNSESGIGSFNILDYDSLDELELLISDIASNCSEAVNFAEVGGGDYVKISDRDACGAVDGSSYHSEGNHEDQQLSPLPVNKPKPPVPPKPSKLFHQNKRPTDLIPKPDIKDDVHSSSSSSSKSELIAVNRPPLNVPERKGILVSSKKEKIHHSSPQLLKPGFKSYQEPNYWAGVSTSRSNGSPSNSNPTPGSYEPNHTTAKAKQPQHQRNDSSPISKATTSRPALPSYEELQRRNKSTYQQHPPSLTPKAGSNRRWGSCEDLLLDHGVYYEKIVPPKPNVKRTFDDDYVPMHSPSSSTSSGSHSVGKGLQVSSHPRHGTSRSASADRQTSGNKPASNPPPPYRPPPAASAAAAATKVVNRMPPSYTAATTTVKKQEQLSVRNQEANSHQSPSERQRFRFDGATMPRFGRNSKLRQSVLPPPCFDRDFSDSYEEQAIDVPGATTAYSEKTRTAEVDSSTLGFYV